MRISIYVTAGTIIFLSACASVNPVPFKGPNGGEAYSMRCSGLGRSWDSCFVKAGELCPTGYNIISQTSSTLIIPSGNSIMAVPKQGLAIECK